MKYQNVRCLVTYSAGHQLNWTVVLDNFEEISRKIVKPFGKNTDGKPIESNNFYQIILKRK